jgi:AcrR family transcriptional regulator
MPENPTASNSHKVRKQQQRSVVTKRKLLGAAIEAFSESGFDGTSTRDIAARAGVHHPLITYHFKNKDQLWRAAAHEICSDFADSLSARAIEMRGKNSKTRAAAMIREYAYFARRQPAMHKVLVMESAHPNPRLDWVIETYLKPFFDASFGILESLQKKGVAPPGNPALLFNMIRMACGGLLALSAELKASSGIDVEAPEVLDELIDMIVAIFLPGEMPD